MASFLLILIYLAFISLGLPDSLLGSGWPAMHEAMNVPSSYMGIVSMVISGGTILSSLASDFLTRKIGTRWVVISSVFLTAAAMLGFSFANQFWMLILLAIPYGLGAGAIDAALNNYVALHYSSRAMSWLHSFWGLGAIASPFVMGYALQQDSWQLGYRIIGLVQAGIGAVLLCTLFAWKKQGDSPRSAKKVGLIQALKIKGVPFLLIGFFAYCAFEATTMQWASTYFAEVKGMGAEKAATLGSLFYIGITLSRFLSGFVSGKLGDKRMIQIGTGVLLVGAILLALPIKQEAFAIAAFLIIGFGCGPIYPNVIHSTPNNFGEENSGAIIGIQMASAYVGSTFMPPLFGLIGRHLGYFLLPYDVMLFALLMIIMLELAFFLARKNRETVPAE